MSPVLKLKTTALPIVIELSGEDGEVDYLEMKLSKKPSTGKIGAYLNRISKPICNLIAGRI